MRGCRKRLAGGETTERGLTREVSRIEMSDLGTTQGKRAQAHSLCPYVAGLCFPFLDKDDSMWLSFHPHPMITCSISSLLRISRLRAHHIALADLEYRKTDTHKLSSPMHLMEPSYLGCD